tara:strand:- start:589 stop:942 length:354 start_codon:yes stop_codon:yes gene_type:complete
MDSSNTIKYVDKITTKMNTKEKELIKIFEELKIAKIQNEYLIPTYLEYEKYIRNIINIKETQLEQIENILNYLHENLLNETDLTKKYNIKLSQKKSELIKKKINNENEKLHKCILKK